MADLAPLPADRLAIADWERDALIRVAADLRAGKPLAMKQCGACIGSMVAATVGRSPARYASFDRSAALRPLFAPGAGTPGIYGHPGWDASSAQGAEAIERFLAGARGRCWDHVREMADG